MSGPSQAEYASNPNVPVMEQAAKAHGVPPALALADAWEESGWSNTELGDQGTSVGLYQLHLGGEYPANEPFPSWGQNPANNANTALAEFEHVAASDPSVRSNPGRWAALSERPANQGAYANSVNALYQHMLTLTGAGGGVGGAATGTDAIVNSAAGGTSGGVSQAAFTQPAWAAQVASALGDTSSTAGQGSAANVLADTDSLTNSLGQFLTGLLWWFNPANWVRVIAGFAGVVAFGVGLYYIAGELKAA